MPQSPVIAVQAKNYAQFFRRHDLEIVTYHSLKIISVRSIIQPSFAKTLAGKRKIGARLAVALVKIIGHHHDLITVVGNYLYFIRPLTVKDIAVQGNCQSKLTILCLLIKTGYKLIHLLG